VDAVGEHFNSIAAQLATQHRISPPSRNCGQARDRRHRTYRGDCLSECHARPIETFSTVRPPAVAEIRGARSDAAHGGAAATARRKRNAAHVAAVAGWEREHGDSASALDPETFARDILPTFQDVSLRATAYATGLTQGYCSSVRRGLKVPHWRHWYALTNLTNAQQTGCSVEANED
jgi:hypothetical protein